MGAQRAYFPQDGYGGWYVRDLIRALRARGNEVEVVTDDPRAKTEWGRPLSMALGLRRRLRSKPTPDVVHIHDERAAPFFALSGIPYVLNIHTASWVRQMRLTSRILFKPEIMGVQRSAGLIVQTERVLQAVLRRCGIPRGLISVIPQGVDPERFHPGNQTVPLKAVGLGVIDRRKRWHMAIEPLAKVGFSLTVVGPIVDQTYAESLRVMGACLTGEVRESELLAQLQSAALCVHPSEAESAVPGAVLQAMAAGKVVVGSHPTVCHPHVVCAPDSHYAQTLEQVARKVAEGHEGWGRDRGEAARAYVIQNHSWYALAAKFEDVYGGLRHIGKS